VVDGGAASVVDGSGTATEASTTKQEGPAIAAEARITRNSALAAVILATTPLVFRGRAPAREHKNDPERGDDARQPPVPGLSATKGDRRRRRRRRDRGGTLREKERETTA
jgi:hypothetical protein